MATSTSSARSPAPTIVLIGPAGVGKSTVGAALARRLGIPFVDLDEIASGYYDEVGQPVERLIDRIPRDGLRAAHRWWQPARAHAATRCVVDHPGSVIALGAGHSHFEDDEFFEPVRVALRSADVVLLLPRPDPEASEAFLRLRCADRGHDWGGLGFLREWIESEHNRAVAGVVVYVADRSPAGIVEQIMRDRALPPPP
jgi:hypothetical protein